MYLLLKYCWQYDVQIYVRYIWCVVWCGVVPSELGHYSKKNNNELMPNSEGVESSLLHFSLVSMCVQA